MEYYGCPDIGGLSLSVGGQLDLPLDHDRNRTIFALCCTNKKVPGIPFGKNPEETLERFLGMRDRLILRGGIKFDFGRKFSLRQMSSLREERLGIVSAVFSNHLCDYARSLSMSLLLLRRQ